MAEPFALRTLTSTLAPTVPGGVVHRSVVSLTTLTAVAGTPPKRTALGPGLASTKPDPVSVTVVPPAAGPRAGATAVSVGVDLVPLFEAHCEHV